MEIPIREAGVSEISVGNTPLVQTTLVNIMV